jgi:hypothetical protein
MLWQCTLTEVGELVECETVHSLGGRRSRWQALATFLGHGLSELRRSRQPPYDRHGPKHWRTSRVERKIDHIEEKAIDKLGMDNRQRNLIAMSLEGSTGVLDGKVVYRPEFMGDARIGQLGKAKQSFTSHPHVHSGAAGRNLSQADNFSNVDIQLVYADHRMPLEQEQVDMDGQLMRWRRMSSDLGTRIELGGPGVGAILSQERLTAAGVYDTEQYRRLSHTHAH